MLPPRQPPARPVRLGFSSLIPPRPLAHLNLDTQELELEEARKRRCPSEDYLLNLPNELICHIFTHLPLAAVANLAQTCSQLSNVLHATWWREYYMNNYASAVRPGKPVNYRTRCYHIEHLMRALRVSIPDTKRDLFKSLHSQHWLNVKQLLLKHQADKCVNMLGPHFDAICAYWVMYDVIYKGWLNPELLSTLWPVLHNDVELRTRFITENNNVATYNHQLLHPVAVTFLYGILNRATLDNCAAMYADDVRMFTYRPELLLSVIRCDAVEIYKAHYQARNQVAAVFARMYNAPRIQAITTLFINMPHDMLTLADALHDTYYGDFTYCNELVALNERALQYLAACCNEEFCATCLYLEDFIDVDLDEGITYYELMQQLLPYIGTRIPTASYYKFLNAGYFMKDAFIMLDPIVKAGFSPVTYMADPLGYAAGSPNMAREYMALLARLGTRISEYGPAEMIEVRVSHKQASDCTLYTYEELDEEFITLHIGHPDYICIPDIVIETTYDDHPARAVTIAEHTTVDITFPDTGERLRGSAVSPGHILALRRL